MHTLVGELQGQWTVTALGTAMPMNLLHDRKLICGRTGHNRINGHDWGWFRVEGDGPELTLNYDDRRNAVCLREVRDTIKRDGDGWIGTLRLDGTCMFAFRLSNNAVTESEPHP